MFPEWGFVDTLAQHSGRQPLERAVALTANPYAAMPSLHSMDAFIVGVVMFGVCRSSLGTVLWLAWPAWVWFSVMATGNHYWLDVAAGSRSRWSPARCSCRGRSLAATRGDDRPVSDRPAGQRARPRQAGVHAGRPADPAALDDRASRRRS